MTASASLVIVATLILFVGGCLPWLLTSGSRLSDIRTDHYEQGYSWLEAPVPSTVTWIGDAWILPPHQRLFRPSEIRDFFNEHSILMVGDNEVARIHYGTIVEILLDSSDHPSNNVLNNSTLLDRQYVVDKSNSIFPGGICRRFNNHKFDFVQLECFDDVRHFLKGKNVESYDMVVIATGRLETAVSFQRSKCESQDTATFPQGSVDRMRLLMDELQRVQVPFIWRNGAYSRQTQHEYVELMDEEVRVQLAKTNVRLIDYAASIRKRVYQRISTERAILFLQLLMNAVTQ